MHTAHISLSKAIAWPLNIYQFIVQMPVKFSPELEKSRKILPLLLRCYWFFFLRALGSVKHNLLCFVNHHSFTCCRCPEEKQLLLTIIRFVRWNFFRVGEKNKFGFFFWRGADILPSILTFCNQLPAGDKTRWISFHHIQTRVERSHKERTSWRSFGEYQMSWAANKFLNGISHDWIWNFP